MSDTCENCGTDLVGEESRFCEDCWDKFDNLKAQLAASEAASVKAERERRLAYAGEQVAIKQRDEARTDLLAAGAVEAELRKAAEKVAGSKLITISHGVELLCVFPEDMAALRAALSLPASDAAQRYRALVEAGQLGLEYLQWTREAPLADFMNAVIREPKREFATGRLEQALRDVGKE